MDASDLNKYKQLYLKTAHDYLTLLKNGLRTFEPENLPADTLSEVHRAAHSLKGQSLVMGYTTTGLLCKKIEDILKQIKDGQLPVTKLLLAHLNMATIALEISLETIKKTNREKDLSSATRTLEQFSALQQK